ncbi:hypothetical protein O181_015663 [Austropuccinia psidii MF-1]|uniref:Uncharacterized protein n=1 Tax=Austropuccinia psidii MF-1 TaxID=1389203 RepID=A0A9Q3C3M7_9BASI|nr:hypothetical protein [Austropuccinia psidii MF-1]
MLRRPPYPASLETRKEIEKHITPGRISHQSSAIDFTSHRASRQRQSSHENVTQSPNPFQHYAQHSDTARPSPSSPLLTLSHPRPYHPHACVVPSRHASDNAYHPYAHVVPSRHASDTTDDPYACVVPSRHASDTAYHPYAHVVPSRHASDNSYPPSRHSPDTAYHPYAHVVPSRHASDNSYPPHASVLHP